MRNNRFRAAWTFAAALILAAGAPAPAASQDTAVDSRWAAAPPTLDGQPGEWPQDTLTLLKKLRVDCAFRNDGRNLYAVLIFRNPKFLSSIAATGLTVYARPEGTKPGTNGVLFVGKTLTADAFIALLESQGTPLTEKEKEYFRIQQQHPVFEAYTVDAHGRTIAPPAPRPDLDPPLFRAAKAGDVVTFELRMPLAAPDKHPAGIGALPGEAVRVSFEWGGTTKELLKAQANWVAATSRGSGGAYDSNQESLAQVFLMGFDRMSSPGKEAKKYKFQAVVRLAEPGGQ